MPEVISDADPKNTPDANGRKFNGRIFTFGDGDIVKGLNRVQAKYNEDELSKMISFSVKYDKGPIAFRYPRGETYGYKLDEKSLDIQIGKGRLIYDAFKNNIKGDIALISIGTRLKDCIEAWKSHATLQRQAGESFNLIIDEMLRLDYKNVSFVPTNEIVERVKSIASNGDIFLTMGAGNIWRSAEELGKHFND